MAGDQPIMLHQLECRKTVRAFVAPKHFQLDSRIKDIGSLDSGRSSDSGSESSEILLRGIRWIIRK